MVTYYKEWWYKYLPTYVNLDEEDVEDYLSEVRNAMWNDGLLYEYEQNEETIKQVIILKSEENE